MNILGCAVGPISIDNAVITPLSGGRAQVHLVIQVLGNVILDTDEGIVHEGFSAYKVKNLILCLPDPNLLEPTLLSQATCQAMKLDDENILVMINLYAEISTIGQVILAIPSLGECQTLESKDGACLSKPINCIPKECVCIKVNKVFDSCFQCDELSKILQKPIIPHGFAFHSACEMLVARTRGFFGTGRGGIRRLIDTGQISLDDYVNLILIPIVGPGGFSSFLNSFFDPSLFVPQPDIQGIYNRYIELFTTPTSGNLQIQLAVQLFTTFLNVFITDQNFLPNDQVCVSGDSTLYRGSLINIDTSTCTFDFDPNQTSLVNDILSDIESILDACCPGESSPCLLSNPQISTLIEILDDINNNNNIYILPLSQNS